VLLKNQTKKLSNKNRKKIQFKAKIEKNLDSLLALIYGKLRRIESRKKIYYIPLPYHDDDMTTTFKLKKKMIVICLLKKNQNDMI